MTSSPSSAPRRGYPLISLFVLIAVSAIITRMFTPLVAAAMDRRVGVNEIAWAMILGLVGGMILGTTVGLYHCRQPLGGLLGFICGVVLGPVIGAVAIVPIEASLPILLGPICGAIMLVGFGALIRLYSPLLPAAPASEQPSPSSEQAGSEQAGRSST